MKHHILIADDSDEWRSILAIALGTIPDAEVTAVDSGEAALEVALRESFDVLVTDVRMHALSGLDLLRKLRDVERWPRRGALVVSGEPAADWRGESLQVGATAFFPKPFSPSEIRRCVVSLLELNL